MGIQLGKDFLRNKSKGVYWGMKTLTFMTTPANMYPDLNIALVFVVICLQRWPAAPVVSFLYLYLVVTFALTQRRGKCLIAYLVCRPAPLLMFGVNEKVKKRQCRINSMRERAAVSWSADRTTAGYFVNTNIWQSLLGGKHTHMHLCKKHYCL